ncbi:MAG: major facilitator superfamily 1 [Symbiobacteriaceae bacterium]|jgi:MFS family permease|nr:major facilitator superfamily 1 [Symbiobacteriaceae bacterium]
MSSKEGLSRSFWLLTAGQTINQMGSSVGGLAQAWLVYDLTGSKVAMGTILLLAMVPETLLRLFGSPLVDRFNRIKMMRLMDLVQAGVYAVTPLLYSLGQLEVWHLYILAVLAGLTHALYQPAFMSLVPSVVPQGALVRANSISQGAANTVTLLGPALGGLVVALAGPVPALVVDAASYGLTALMLFALPLGLGAVERRRVSGGYVQQLTEGVRFVWQTPVLLVTLGLAAAWNLNAAAGGAMLVPIVRDQLGAGATGVGALVSAAGAGMLAGSLLAGWKGEFRRRRFSMTLPLMLAGLTNVAMAWVGNGGLPVAMVLWASGGFIMSFFTPQSMALFQSMVPDDLRGRVMAVRLTVAWGVMPMGSFIGALVAEHAGVSMMQMLFGLVPILAGLAAMGSVPLRSLDHEAARPAGARTASTTA